MTIELRMPALSPTMEEGTLAKWLVSEGDEVRAGDLLAEIETDKATMEVEAADEGIIGRILVPDGTEGVPVGTVIAILLEEGEEASDAETAAAAAAAAAKPGPEPPAVKPVPEAPVAPTIPAAADPEPAAPPPVPAAAPPSGGRIKASPLARRMAKDSNIPLETIQGSGPHGRIVKRDMEAAAAGGAAVARPTPAPVPTDTPYVEERLSTMRKIIARRLEEAKATVPHFYLTLDVEIDKLLKLRKELNEELGKSKVSLNDFIIRAVALALGKVPDANVQFAGDMMRRFERADVSVAVATDGGLITPIIRDAGNKSVVQISIEMKDLAERARSGKLLPEEYQGGTISISNLGMYGIREFSAVINPPQAAILAIGKGEERPIVRHGAVQIATLMTVTISADHRAIDGVIGARFLNAFKDYLEAPLTMLI
ncbi:MAG: pyruvate dehydrogenase complex dihydrolipoamide acetyltransferase [Proteobacteria bacterium]|nr:pyruvate dehydrogenase complex dihydrolipoamide acetyltransferase [Pseudomonadota bacterium]